MIYVTSDWNGYPLEDIRAMFKKARFTDSDFCFVLGNAIDRGDEGVKLLDWLAAQYNIELLRGSAEQHALDCGFLFGGQTPPSEGRDALQRWLAEGGAPTVAALNEKKAEEKEYLLEFLEETPLYETVNAGGRDFILTHAGLGGFRPEKKLSAYAPEELLNNTPALTDRYFEDVTAVFGHTPTHVFGDGYAGKILTADTWTDVDTGASDGYAPALLRLDDGKVFYAD